MKIKYLVILFVLIAALSAGAKTPAQHRKALSIEEVCDLGYNFISSDENATHWYFQLRANVCPPFGIFVEVSANPTEEQLEEATIAATFEARVIKAWLQKVAPKTESTPNPNPEMHL